MRLLASLALIFVVAALLPAADEGSDDWIHDHVRMRLASDRDIRGNAIEVTVGGQNVPLYYAGGAPCLIHGVIQINAGATAGVPPAPHSAEETPSKTPEAELQSGRYKISRFQSLDPCGPPPSRTAAGRTAVRTGGRDHGHRKAGETRIVRPAGPGGDPYA